ncbi:MAG: phospho-N-acetylmuramoyl-pentapeptide-transferase [Saprospiraceae bacterium]|nr:phospho-N-acetylmuramoyl-pentapeptide-transferase [Saprospiraceae bacterium]
MLTHLFEYLDRLLDIPGSGLFRYITFRAGGAIILSLLISMVFGAGIIRKLKRLQIGETVRDLGLTGQKEKEGTPTMGGIIIVLAIVIPCLLLARLDNIYIQLMLLSTIWMAVIGFMDDYIKVFKKNKEGLKAIFKIIGQVGLGLIVGLVMLYHEDVTVRMPIEEAEKGGYTIVETYKVYDSSTDAVLQYAHVKTTLTNIPFVKSNRLDYQKLMWFLGDNAGTWAWILFIPIIILIVTAVSNAANLTDGIDGLATGISGIIAATLGVFAYVSSNAIFSQYLGILFLPDSAELVIFAACLVGACVGFLWYNAYPAQIFMGDTGSLTLGGIIAALAIVLRKELLIPILCGIFLIENLSVMIQVGYFKYTRKKYGTGKRVFLMSPLHHHYQKQGMHEAKIVARFWIVGILLAVFTIITLKIR